MNARRIPASRLPLRSRRAGPGGHRAGRLWRLGKAAAVAGAAGTDGRAAQAFPASTVAFADANIDEQSDAWKRLLALGARFPSWPKLVAEFDKSANQATDGGPTLAQVRSWLGSEVAVGVLDVPTDGNDPQVLGFAEVTDRSGLEGALKKQKNVTPPARTAASTSSRTARGRPSWPSRTTPRWSRTRRPW